MFDLILTLILYVLPTVTAYIVLKMFYEQNTHKHPTLGDVFCVFCPFINMMATIHGLTQINFKVRDTSKFFRIKKVDK